MGIILNHYAFPSNYVGRLMIVTRVTCMWSVDLGFEVWQSFNSLDIYIRHKNQINMNNVRDINFFTKKFTNC